MPKLPRGGPCQRCGEIVPEDAVTTKWCSNRCRLAKWRSDNRYILREKEKTYWRKNKEKKAAKDARSHAKHRKARLAAQAEYRDLKKDDPIWKEKQRAAVRKWKQDNPDKVRAERAKYRQDYPEKHCATEAARRARKREQSPQLSDLEHQVIVDIYAECQRISGETHELWHVDHVQPLAKGGQHHPSNLQILRANENCSKGATWNEER